MEKYEKPEIKVVPVDPSIPVPSGSPWQEAAAKQHAEDFEDPEEYDDDPWENY